MDRGTEDQPRPPRVRSARVIDLPSVGPVALAMAFAVGAYAYFTLPAEPPWPLVLTYTLAAGLALALARRWSGRWGVLLAGALFALGLGGSHAKHVALNTDTVTVTGEVGPVQLEGWLKQVETGARGPRLRIAVQAVQGMDADGVPALVRVTHPLSLNVSPGRFVRCRVVLRPPPSPSLPGDYDFQRQAFFQGLGAVGYVQGRCRGGTLGAPDGALRQADLWVDSQRRMLAEYVNVHAGGFAAALIAGDRSFMAQADQEALRASGLAHLLAISGLHLGIVCGLVYVIVRRGLAVIEPLAVRVPVQKPAAAAALVAGACYLLLSGASVSTQRAFIMAAIFFTAILLDRPGFSLRAFAVAMVAVILIDPVSVVSPGFQMSFAATGALIATYEAWLRGREDAETYAPAGRIVGWFQSLLVTSVVASAATAPFAIYHFDRVAGAGLIANLLAMPIVSLVAAPSAALSALLAPIGLDRFGLYLFGQSLDAILAVAHWAAALPGQAVGPSWPMPAPAFAVSIAAMAGAVLLRGWARWGAMGLGAILVAALWMSQRGPDVHWSPSGDLYTMGPAGALRIEVVNGNGLSPLRHSDLEVGAQCQSGRCAFPTHNGTAEIIWPDPDPNTTATTPADEEAPPPNPILCWRASAAPAAEDVPGGTSTDANLPTPRTRTGSPQTGDQPCLITTTWSATQRAGGFTHISQGGHLAAMIKARPARAMPPGQPNCAPRPWRACT